MSGRTVKGRVADRLTNEGLPLVRVIIKGTTQGVETELDGTFTLPNVPTRSVTLLFSSQDYGEREVLIGANQRTVEVAMENIFAEEMVVVGRASEVARKNLANSVASVNSEEINRAPAQTVDQALQGKVAGANIQSNGGAPGGGLQLRLRGVSTINGSSAPLYVIDGVLVSDVAIASGVFAITESVAGANANPTQDNQVNRIADINPNDIESIEVLKGASAAAIYGSKAANGVVIINTKRGRSSEPQFEVTQRLGMYTLANKLGTRRFNSVEEVRDTFGEAAVQYYEQGRRFDHEATLAGRRDLSSETLASVSGVTGNTKYFASAMIKNDEGIIANTGYEKQSFRLNLGQKLGDAVEVNVATNLVHSLGQRGLTNNDNASISNYMVLPRAPEFLPLEANSDGVYPQNPFLSNRANPLQTAALVKNDENVWRFIGSGDLTWHLWKTEAHHLRVLANAGVDRFQQENSLFFPPELNFEPIDDGLPGSSLFGTSQVRNLNSGLNLVHTYKPTSGGIVATTSGGLQFEERNIDSIYIVSKNLNAGQQNVDSGTVVNLRQNRSLVRDRGYYVQEEVLLLDERLTLVGALRGEQSSANGNPNALFLYPKLASAYRIPSFHPKVNEFKVRAAYGETGNLPLYGMKFNGLRATGNIAGSPGLVGTGIAGDRNIKPERQREVEAGVDALLFGGDVVAEVSIYQRNISDLLLQRALAPSGGFATQIFNGGSLRNRGVEAMVQVTPVRGGFEWTSGATFALNRSRVTDLPVPAFLAGGFGTALGAFRIQEGATATQIVGNDGVDENGRPIVRKLGDTEPTFRMSFTNSLKYRDFSLSFLFDWQQGSDIINLTRYIYDDAGTSPDFTTGGRERLVRQRTHASTYIEDASFLKLREVTFMYQLPKDWVSMVPAVKSARLSLSGRNLITLTGYSGLDPEVSNFGNQAISRNVDVAPFPPSRSFWTSLDVGF
ncbi:TonB-dependent receptor [Myxococcus xanthus DK 1622]|uniref:TonB-dependent receptor n=1 Tax=Myxococcus xanthus (strain DK1622) TaxID=246197 RepID=Q1D365_MYXXD|nr:SusC/RagA family TonB-linked outer membrane protein [Myxococcus xanthus]ABF87024.1 TonB-dependent receptor [Myxococcus xanthus DK 1622]QVW71975.1 SusC/RagA family TonB-linked outer membrane protein [Myxococcus xanthus DZ2]NOJ52488.1 SusC/RagA family TonB-linked outer membrane protein [Myxococcus xanthus]QPM83411.1 SusC/RagA family TonB-linked outer membrane protein [Myxococcus xanthus]UEO08544.1 SusC/RagA family TonB-linked outer membrane protein [Myxococcus xanthus DZ2]